MHFDWNTVLQQLDNFVNNFSVDQIRASPLACEPLSVENRPILNINTVPNLSLVYSLAVCNLIHRFTELLCLQHKVRGRSLYSHRIFLHTCILFDLCIDYTGHSDCTACY